MKLSLLHWWWSHNLAVMLVFDGISAYTACRGWFRPHIWVCQCCILYQYFCSFLHYVIKGVGFFCNASGTKWNKVQEWPPTFSALLALEVIPIPNLDFLSLKSFWKSVFLCLWDSDASWEQRFFLTADRTTSENNENMSLTLTGLNGPGKQTLCA